MSTPTQQTQGDARLPAEFADLERFDAWMLATTGERIRKRLGSSRDEILDFHTAAAPRIDEMVAYLNDFPLNDMPPRARVLFDLLLSLAEIGPYAEWFDGEPESPIAKGVIPGIEMLSEPA